MLENFRSTNLNVLALDITIRDCKDPGAYVHIHLCTIKHNLKTMRSLILSQFEQYIDRDNFGFNKLNRFCVFCFCEIVSTYIIIPKFNGFLFYSETN